VGRDWFAGFARFARFSEFFGFSGFARFFGFAGSWVRGVARENLGNLQNL